MKCARSTLLVVAAILFAPVAVAAPQEPGSRPGPTATQESNGVALFKEAKALLSQGRFELACQRFAESYKAEPSVGALLNIADCQERAGKLVAARSSYVEAHALAMKKSDPDRALFADNRAKELDARVPRLRIELPEPNARGLVVTIDGVPVPDNGQKEPVLLDPGAHRLQASAEGRALVSREVSIPASEHEVYVAMPPFESASFASSEPPAADETFSAHDRGSRIDLAFPSFVAGGGLIAGGLIVGAVAIVRWNDFLDQCPDRKCADERTRFEARPAHDSAQLFATTSTVLVVSGVALVGLGFFFHLRDDRSAVIVPAAGPRTAGAQLVGSF